MKAKPTNPEVDVIIVNYNAGTMLRDCVAALAQQDMDNFRVFLIDNASSDGSIEALPPLDDRFEVIQLDENTGFAKGNNIGAARGTAPWIALLNPDAYAEPGWLSTLLKTAQSDPSIVMAGSTQIDANSRHLLDGAGDLYAPIGFAWRGLWHRPLALLPQTGEVFGPCAAAALYRRDAFEAVNGFDEDFFCYHEDVDLAFRLRLAGGRGIQVSEAVVFHEGSGVAGAQSPFAVFHGTRNRTWTFVKNMPLGLMILFLPFHVGLVGAFIVRAIFKGQFLPTMTGVTASVAGLGKAFAKRKDVQSSRQIRPATLLKAFTWSPITFFCRGADVRHWRRLP
ncbi:MAG: glycosyl transferase [Robiginitomaculum sp.]|nr:MAG: glycosyl transferase [Robiginitomaculum sp.]